MGEAKEPLEAEGDHVDFRKSEFYGPVIGVQHNHYARAPIDELGNSAAQIVRDLKTEMRYRTRRQAVERELGPHTLDIPWSSEAMNAASPPRVLTGRLSGLHDVFLALPHRRMIILGGAGTGKTVSALLLTLRLLEAGGPVPVLLEVASWSPPEDGSDRGISLLEWCSSRISALLPGDESARRTALARDLLAGGWVIPVLDGLDEIFGGVEPRTVRALNQAVVEMPGFLLTCREREFSEATDAAGIIVADTTLVRFQPLSSAAVTDYLTAGRTATDTHWDAVIKAMQRAPEGPLPRVLSVPLMAWLARSAYTHPSTRPDELCMPGLDEAALENLLLTRYFPAVYDTRRSGLHRFDAGRATKWLGILAGQLAVNRQGNDWMWWELDATVRPSRIGLLISSAATILWWLALILGYTLPPYIVEDFTVVVTVPDWVAWLGDHPLSLVGVFYFLLIFDFFPWEKIKIWHILAAPPFPWIARIVNHLAQGMVVGIWQAGFLIFPLFATAVTLGPFIHALAPSLPSPGSFAAGIGVLAGVAMVCVFNQWMAHAGEGEGFGFHKDAYLSDSRTARSAVRRARRDFFTVFGFLTTIIVSASLLVSERSPRMLAGAALAICVISLIPHVWPYYLAARVWLAMAGLLPWRLLRFLDDAAARGVLRRSGPSYQFRHARLQAHLAAAHPQQRTVWSEGPTRGRGRAQRQSG